MYKIRRFCVNFFWHYVDILSYKFSFFAKRYEKTIGEEYKKEIEAFDISKNSKILHIGVGAYPISAFILSNLKNVQIVGIDRNPNSVIFAKKLIKKRKLDHKISIELGDGQSYPIDPFDLIVVSGCSIPKIPVLKNVFESARPKTKIIVREGKSTINSIQNLIDSYENIVVNKDIICNPLPAMCWKSFFIEKK